MLKPREKERQEKENKEKGIVSRDSALLRHLFAAGAAEQDKLVKITFNGQG